jgi:hypothetical protein
VKPTANEVSKVQEETGRFLLSKLDKSADDAKATNVRQEVLLGFENLRERRRGASRHRR